jgi:hypothetical protein
LSGWPHCWQNLNPRGVSALHVRHRILRGAGVTDFPDVWPTTSAADGMRELESLPDATFDGAAGWVARAFPQVRQ